MPASNKQISDALDRGIQAASSQSIPLWLGATDAVVSVLVEEGDCFSSGEIASFLRTFRPDLRFSVTSNVGEHLRDRFYGCSLPLYSFPDGSTTPVEQVSRTTQGFTRTPPGTAVFVYGPGQQACLDHDFEVEIPKPGVQTPVDPTDQHGLPAKPAQAPTPLATSHFVTLKPRVPAQSLTATVHNDSRLCIPRAAIEALLHETKTALKGGDSVYVLVDDVAGEARIGLDRETGAQGYQLSAARGRVLFPHPAHPFTVGDSFTISIEGVNRRLVVSFT